MEKKGFFSEGSGVKAAGVLFEEEESVIAGGDINIRFAYKGKEFYSQKFKSGNDFQWVKHKVSEYFDIDYDDITLHYNGQLVLEPLSIVDLHMKDKDILEIKIENPEAIPVIENEDNGDIAQEGIILIILIAI